MDDTSTAGGELTAGDDYAERLERKTSGSWRRFVDPQIPYAWNVRRLCRGRVLDVGCGIGRNLVHLRGSGIGVDHNKASIETARRAGLEAYVTEDFLASALAQPNAFDTLLAAHLLEHVDEATGDSILATYAKFVRPGGRVVLICPQERGYDSDATHIRWLDVPEMSAHLERLGARVLETKSFPFPRGAGRRFTYNETVVVGELPA